MHRFCKMVCLKFLADYYTHSCDSSLLLFVINVMVRHFVSHSHKVMTALIVMLPSNYLLWRFVCSFIDILIWTCTGWIVMTMKLSKSCTWERAAVICAAPSCLWTESDFMCTYRKPGVLLHRPMVHFDAHIVIKPWLIQQSAVRKTCTLLLQLWCL